MRPSLSKYREARVNFVRHLVLVWLLLSCVVLYFVFETGFLKESRRWIQEVATELGNHFGGLRGGRHAVKKLCVSAKLTTIRCMCLTSHHFLFIHLVGHTDADDGFMYGVAHHDSFTSHILLFRLLNFVISCRKSRPCPLKKLLRSFINCSIQTNDMLSVGNKPAESA